MYDTSKGFSLFMKYNFAHSVEIKSCGYKKKFRIETPESFDASFFILNSVEDFMLFKNACLGLKNIFVSSPIKMLEDKIGQMELEELIVFDFSQLKSEVLDTIQANLLSRKILSSRIATRS